MRTHRAHPIAVLAAAAFLAAAAHAQSPNNPRAAARCIQSTVHPLSVRVRALDPVARGAVVRLSVVASSLVPLERVDVQLVSTGGATLVGPSSAALGRLDPGRLAGTEFTVVVPPTGGRQYVQFRVVGQGANGNLTRGACYNLLPDGPLQAGRLVTTPAGTRVLEVRAGRID